MADPSARAEAITRRTYNRPLDEEGNQLETWEVTAKRATYDHHLHLWESANTNGCTPNLDELKELQQLVTSRQALVAGRTLWLGGTPYGKDRACSQFNCAYTRAQTVYQFVDTFWLLLNGCGVGFRPVAGTLHGFLRPITDVKIISSERPADYHGNPANEEECEHQEDGWYWTIRIGDSAEAWAKALGKLVNPPRHAIRQLTLDFSDVRGPGKRLKGYGWICNGSKPLEVAFRAIIKIMNSKAGDLLDEIDLLDIVNHLGTVLSSRRSAQISLMDWGHPRWEQFARAKKDWFLYDQEHRQQSNNSLTFWSKPTKRQIRDIMEMIWECGGSEPGFVNGAAARRRAPWFDGVNPCGEILLPPNGFCNLVTTAVPKFRDNFAGLLRALHIMSRANYRQTCVELEDNVLSSEWHQTNEALRLCGVSLTGLAQAPWLTDYQIKTMRNTAIAGTYSMADELGLPRPKLVTTLKPEGTGSKCIDVTEGIHTPPGKFIFNWVSFNNLDPIIKILAASGYTVIPHPTEDDSTLICFPVEWQGVRFSKFEDKWVNQETAVQQLNKYRRWNTLWTDHNTSITVSWDISELDDIVDWLYKYWEDFVGVSWMTRIDATKSAADLGFKYLPQDVVNEDEFRSYQSKLGSVDWSELHGIYDVSAGECSGGTCPVK